ncbi:hypothetical protein [Salinibacter altiplanensis]|uniref:hypothetical protein n=1 Tax=Salinibacter altiplanensis TaxID=1803181 RepID=UPI000C9F6338|nr:hypothetical protein [Salinibacter altiplanensis]
MPTWAQRLRRSTGVSTGEEPGPHLGALSGWLRRTRQAAEGYGRHATKQAVRDVDPTAEEQEALTALFALQAETIYWVCSDLLERYTESAHADRPSLQLEDLLAEAYPLFLRALVRYDQERPLEVHVRRAFRDRARDYIESRLHRPASNPEGHPHPVLPDTPEPVPEVDVGAICEELQEEGFVPELGESSERKDPPDTP